MGAKRVEHRFTITRKLGFAHALYL